MQKAGELGDELVVAAHQRALAISLMHGARRRLQATLSAHCPRLPVTVSTIHSFALGLVNRWRRSLNIGFPVTVCVETCGLAERYLRTQATFDEVMQLACRLLESDSVGRTISETYPLVIVDEFQDCTGHTLQFVRALGRASRLLLAADDFQMLNETQTGCPAVAWAQSLRSRGEIEYEELAGSRRTHNSGILRAAGAVRGNTRATALTVPVYYAPNVGPAACRIVGRFTPWAGNITAGTCALITLSIGDPLLPKLLRSFQSQLAKKNPRLNIQWTMPLPEAEHKKNLCAELGIGPVGSDAIWNLAQSASSSQADAVKRDIERFSRLRGIDPIPQELAAEFATLAVHNCRAFSWLSPRFQVLTVHGAKNREFDHVFVFWTYKAENWSVEDQRRLLYNAVTRAKHSCTVVALGDTSRISEDPVLSLLGPAAPAIDPSWKKPKKAARVKGRSIP